MNNNINNGANSNPDPSKNNDNDNNEKKTAEVEKKSAVPILSVGLTWILCLVLLRFRVNATNLFLITVLSFVVYQIVKRIFPPKKVDILAEQAKNQAQAKQKADEAAKNIPAVELTPEERELKDMNDKIDANILQIQALKVSIDDESITSELLDIENSVKKIKKQLNDDKKTSKSKKIEQLSEFFDYYMPATIKILKSYDRIKSQGLTGDNAMETKKRVEESLPLIKNAFEKQLDYMFSDEMLDITTDIDVLEAMLSKDGLIDKNNLESVKDTKNDFFN